MNGVQFPHKIFWKRRALRPEDRWVLRLVEGFEQRLVEHLGRELTFPESQTAEVWKTATACRYLCFDQLSKTGIMRQSVSKTTTSKGDSSITEKGEELHQAFRDLPKFMKIELDAGKVFGYEPKELELLNAIDLIRGNGNGDAP